MDKNKIFKELGFNEYETKIYLTLNKLKSATATQISQNSTVPRNKVYEVIDIMIKKGFIMELPIKPKQYKITSLDKLNELIEEKKQNVNILDSLTKNLIDNLKKENFQGKPDEKVWLIKGQKNIVEKIAYEMNNVQEESLSMFRNNAAIGSSYRNTKKAMEKGVKIKIIGCLNDKKSLEKLKPYLDLGIEFRIYNEEKFGDFGTRFTIFDKKKCRITIGKPEVEKKEDYITMWIESPSLVNLMRILFLMIWEQCEPIDKYTK